MQSFEVHRPGESSGQRDDVEEKPKSIRTMALLFCLLLLWRISLMLEMMDIGTHPGYYGNQYRLVPSEMIPGLPPGRLVRVRVAPMHDPDAFRGMAMHDPSAEAHAALARMMSRQPYGAQPFSPYENMDQGMQSILQSMADGAGDHGNTGGMDREDTPELLTVQAHLPGHHMLGQKQTFDATERVTDHDGQAEVNPLDVKLLDRTLLVRGTMRKPMPGMGDGVYVTSSFQRAIWLPANAITGQIQCEYGRKSGNLVIKIPKDATKPEKDDADEDHPVEDQQRVEKIRASFQDFQRRVKAMQSRSEGGVRSPGAVHGVNYDDLKERLREMHDDGNGVQLQDSAPHLNAVSKDSVEYLGCFRSWDLPQIKKQLPSHAASSFAKAVVAAAHDAIADESEPREGEEDQYFFAMARHDPPHKSGVAFTFRRFDHEIEGRHAVTCGNHCEDDGTWFCGALGDADHHSEKVESGVDSALFAVYALKNPQDISPQALGAAEAADAVAEQGDHPQWRLIDDFNGGESKVELIVPKESSSVTYQGKTASFWNESQNRTATVALPVAIHPANCNFGAVSQDSQTRVVSCLVGADGFQVIKVTVKDEL